MKSTISLARKVLAAVFFLAGCVPQPQAPVERKIERVEHGLLSNLNDPFWKRMDLEERMAYYHVPGVSIAMIDGNQVEWARGYGVLAAGTSEEVTAETLFQPASIAKLVVAVTALHLVEAGTLDLDRDVNQDLVSWKLPEDEYTQAENVTLRRLLSHSAGTTVSGFPGYAVDEALPDLQQILDGLPPANSPPVRVDTVPGTIQRYSGGGYMIVQQLVEDVAGQPLVNFAQQTVLVPWEMGASTLQYPLPTELEPFAATGHRLDGSSIPGGWHVYPEVGAGASMWSTATDLANFAIHLIQAYNGNPDEVLSQAMTIEILTPQIENRGLGPVLGDDGADRFYFMHPGGNEGYRSVLVAYPERGQGVVILTNGDGGEALWREILNGISVEYGWVQRNIGWYLGIALAILLLLGVAVLILLRIRSAGRSK